MKHGKCDSELMMSSEPTLLTETASDFRHSPLSHMWSAMPCQSRLLMVVTEIDRVNKGLTEWLRSLAELG